MPHRKCSATEHWIEKNGVRSVGKARGIQVLRQVSHSWWVSQAVSGSHLMLSQNRNTSIIHQDVPDIESLRPSWRLHHQDRQPGGANLGGSVRRDHAGDTQRRPFAQHLPGHRCARLSHPTTGNSLKPWTNYWHNRDRPCPVSAQAAACCRASDSGLALSSCNRVLPHTGLIDVKCGVTRL